MFMPNILGFYRTLGCKLTYAWSETPPVLSVELFMLLAGPDCLNPKPSGGGLTFGIAGINNHYRNNANSI